MHDDRLERIRLTTIRVARRRGIRPSHYQDFVQDVLMHLLEHRPQWLSGSPIHDSALWPLLDTFAIAWLRNRLGRWRPSAAARALGTTAIDLERLVVRDGWTRADAVEAVLVSSHGTIRREALEATADTLRLVPRSRDVALDGISGADATPCSTNAPDLDAMASAAREALATALECALRDVGEEDQRILALKFAREMTMAEIAAALGMAPGSVQKRYDRLKPRLRANLEGRGICLADVNAALHAPGLNSPLLERLLRDGDEPRKNSRTLPRRRETERERVALTGRGASLDGAARASLVGRPWINRRGSNYSRIEPRHISLLAADARFARILILILDVLARARLDDFERGPHDCLCQARTLRGPQVRWSSPRDTMPKAKASSTTRPDGRSAASIPSTGSITCGPGLPAPTRPRWKA